MRTMLACLTLIVALPLTPRAQEQESPAPPSKPAFPTAGQIELYKDPLVASYLSATVPGLGQMYVGNKRRGFLFLAGVVGALGSAYAFYEPAELDMADYDDPLYGGNGDGLMSTGEVRNWQGKKAEGDAFGDLSTGRKVGAITGLATGVGLYIWNIIDARNQAREHNRALAQRRMDVGLLARPGRAGLALNLRF